MMSMLSSILIAVAICFPCPPSTYVGRTNGVTQSVGNRLRSSAVKTVSPFGRLMPQEARTSSNLHGLRQRLHHPRGSQNRNAHFNQCFCRLDSRYGRHTGTAPSACSTGRIFHILRSQRSKYSCPNMKSWMTVSGLLLMMMSQQLPLKAQCTVHGAEIKLDPCRF